MLTVNLILQRKVTVSPSSEGTTTKDTKAEVITTEDQLNHKHGYKFLHV